MKALSIFLANLLFLTCLSYGQTGGDRDNISTISLAVAMPREIKDLGDGQMSILENRIKNIVSMNGLSAEGGLEGFVIYPKFDILGREQARSTIKTIMIAKCNLSLFVRQFVPNATSNIVFSSFNLEITGSGYTEEEAITNALNQIRPGDDAIQGFLNKTRERIVTYYKQNCDKIITEATNAANLENYHKSFALLLSIPKEASLCYGQVQTKTIEIYLKKQKQDCNRLLLKAKTYAAAGDFTNALDTLRKVDPESVCKEDLWTLLNEIETKVDARDKQILELYKEQLRNNTEIEKARYSAISEMGKAYMEGQGRRSYIVNGNGANASIQPDPPYSSGYPVQQVKTTPGREFPNNLPTANPSSSSSPSDLLATTTIKPYVLFDNNIFPSFIISRASYISTDNMKKYGDVNSCLGISIFNASNGGTLTYEIEPVENKFFDKVTGSISFVQNQPREYFPEIPWKYDALQGLQQSTSVSIKFKLIDKSGKVKESLAKVRFRSIRECITSFTFDGKREMTTLLAAYVNEENPQIDKFLKLGIEKNWVSGWAGYQEGREGLDRQVKAIWKILSSKGIRYSDITGATTNTSASFSSQTVRPFCESISNKQANCVEGTLVFASILKKLDIRPAIVLIPGHCFLAYHPTADDTNNYIFLETTLLGNIKGQPTEVAFDKNYADALKAGQENFDAAKGAQILIDLEKARMQKVLPLNLSDEACK